MKDSVRQKIIEKARDMLFTRNEEEITMIGVANELGITAPTLYHYFTGKDELLDAGNSLITKEITEISFMKFPSSMPAKMKIVTIASIVAEYFLNSGLPISYLVEDPKDRPVVLKDFRDRITSLFAEYLKNKKGTHTPEKMAYRFLSALQADMILLRKNKGKLEEDLAEKVFEDFV
ncbi:MAG TPA: TetR/AcrR family transcriptional regulator [bacterium]|nr:TetR/AcrR family transcriptional regulator [bacterium]